MSTLQVGTILEKVTDAGVAVDGVTLKDGDVTIADKIIHDGDTNTAIRFPSADTVTIETGGSERARVDSSGNVLFSTTSSPDTVVGSSGAGMAYEANGFLGIARAGTPLIINRRSTAGEMISLKKDGAVLGKIEIAGADSFIGNNTRGIKLRDTSIIPRTINDGSANDVMDLGSSASRYDDVFATNGTINTSDRNEKQDIEELSDAEKRVAVVAKGLMRKYRWKTKVAEKGDKARTHFGIIAQDLQDAFKAEGLDASKYAMFCSDTWWEKEEKYIDDDNKEQTRIMDYEKEEDAPKDAIKKTRLGVRYSELLAFIISAI